MVTTYFIRSFCVCFSSLVVYIYRLLFFQSNVLGFVDTINDGDM